MELTLRLNNSGGQQVINPRGEEGCFFPRKRFIWLIHGYNVSELEAKSSFEKFEKHLDDLSSTLTRDICRVYWPGDSIWPGIKVAAYPWRVDNAKSSGQSFKGYLENLSDRTKENAKFYLVAHSLGCRMLIEAINALKLVSPDIEISVFLLAAAIPVGSFMESGEYRLLAEKNVKTYVLYSRHDSVLASAFRLGQSVAPGENYFFPEAVGYYGRPFFGVWDKRKEMSGYGHGDYWDSDKTAYFIASQIDFTLRKQYRESRDTYRRAGSKMHKLKSRRLIGSRYR